jgi:ribosomal protein S18 acetylase RimI-like enzyme
MAIREANPSDVPQLAALFTRQLAWQRQLSRDADLCGGVDVAALFLKRIRSPQANVFVEDRDGSLDGYAIVRFVDPDLPSTKNDWWSRLKAKVRRPRKSECVFQPRRYGILEDWFVVEDCRRQGIGTRLFQAAETWLAEREITCVDAATWFENEAAQRLFARLGFRTVRLLYRKDLAVVSHSQTEKGARERVGMQGE